MQSVHPEDDPIFVLYARRMREIINRGDPRSLTIEAAASMMVEAYQRGRGDALSVIREEVRAGLDEKNGTR